LTYVTKPTDIKRTWHLIDAEGKILGRLASEVSKLLMGKHKPYYVPHLDTGDFVVVINARKIATNEKRLRKKVIWRHSGYPGGIKSTSAWEVLKNRPEDLIYRAVKGMLPKNKLGRKMLKKLKVYPDSEHPHQAQGPKPLELLR
jgi:large subunit ribosomal protein L13